MSAQLKDGSGINVFSLDVQLGAYSLPEDLGYSWSIQSYVGRELVLVIDFEKPLYVSTEEDPEYLEIVIRDGSLFLSQEGLPLEINQQAQGRLL